MKELLRFFAVAILIIAAKAQSPSAPIEPPVEPAPMEAPVTPPVEAPMSAPVETPVEAPVAAPLAAPVATPVAVPVEPPVTPPVSAPVATPVEAPVAAPMAPPVAEPIAGPVAAPTMAPVSAPVLSPVASPTAIPGPVAAPISSSCDVNDCQFAKAVGDVSDIYFGGAVGAKYSPRCIRVPTGTTVRFWGNFDVHPLVFGTVVGAAATPVSSPIVGISNYSIFFASNIIAPFYCNTHYGEGMKGVIYVGDSCSTGAPIATTAPLRAPSTAPIVTADVPVSSLYCEINGCNSRNTRQFSSRRPNNEEGNRAIEFGGDRGLKYSFPCLFIPTGGSISFIGDFTKYPIQTGIADGVTTIPYDNLALTPQLKGFSGFQNVTIENLPTGIYPYYNPQYQSLGMYGALFVGTCSDASAVAAPFGMIAALLVSIALLLL